ncbi:PAS domain-containing protein [Muricauda sp. ANG21]|uniref:PAS domain-containing protein n=1 Tax=Allomuricauda sp. ANG21 TaxID=3042468 RepID=UPI0034552A6E
MPCENKFSFCRALEYSEEELHSKLISEFICHENRERAAAQREKLIEKVLLASFENRYVCKSGDLVWLHWTSIPMRNARLI